MHRLAALLVLSSWLVAASPARAQTPPAAPPPPPVAGEAPQAASPPAAADGGRLRFGIDGTAGLESVSGGGASASGLMYGLDVRVGWQFSHLLAVYGQAHLSFGSITASGSGASITGYTGTFISTVMAEATFGDRFFAGAGLGYGVLNNPSGLALDARVGAYPLMGRGEDGVRRKGLMLALDVRSVFITGATGILVMGCVGYEAF